MISVQEQTILLISDDAALCAAARQQLESREEGFRVAAVSTVDAARRVVEDAAPYVILLEDTSLTPEPEGPVAKLRRLHSTVSALAIYAPVIVIGQAEQEMELSSLIAAGAADFVVRSGSSLLSALALIDKRLRQGRQLQSAIEHLPSEGGPKEGEAFGELLRHELNNPLTGILGNAELLLAEVRRKNDGRLPHGGQKRLETIAALAVRLRETVRRLSQDWDTRHRAA